MSRVFETKINELKIPQSKRYSCLKMDGHKIKPDFVRIRVNLTKPGRIGMYLDTKYDFSLENSG